MSYSPGGHNKAPQIDGDKHLLKNNEALHTEGDQENTIESQKKVSFVAPKVATRALQIG